jgi:hypothetical protein
MKVFGFLLLIAGWLLVLATIVLLSTITSRAGFITAGIAVEILGLTLAARAHLIPEGDKG